MGPAVHGAKLEFRWRGFVSGETANYGWILKFYDENVAVNLGLASRSFRRTDARPRLVLVTSLEE